MFVNGMSDLQTASLLGISEVSCCQAVIITINHNQCDDFKIELDQDDSFGRCDSGHSGSLIIQTHRLRPVVV